MNPSEDLPALLGGQPIRPPGPPNWPLPDEDISRALLAAFHDGSWGKYHGGNVERLEQRLAEYHNAAHAATCGSGTFAVEIALRALKIGPGDEVLLAAYDYPGNFLSVHAVGALPILVDVDAENWNLSTDALAEAVGPKTRALIASHLHGGMVPMREVCAFAAERGLKVIEDVAQAPGAMVQDRRAGSWGDVGVLSFGGSKLLTAGRGGALLTRQADLHQRIRTCLHRGNHICPLSELQAAVLLPQIDKLGMRNDHRADMVAFLTECLHDIPGLRSFVNRVPCRPAYYKLGFQLDESEFRLERDRFLAAMRAEGIALDAGFNALHIGRSPSRFRLAGELSEAERAHRGAVVLHHPVLLGDRADVEQVAQAIRKVHNHAARLSEL